MKTSLWSRGGVLFKFQGVICPYLTFICRFKKFSGVTLVGGIVCVSSWIMPVDGNLPRHDRPYAMHMIWQSDVEFLRELPIIFGTRGVSQGDAHAD